MFSSYIEKNLFPLEIYFIPNSLMKKQSSALFTNSLKIANT